jgi:hypothetical protein
MPHIHRHLNISVLLTEGQAGETTTKYEYQNMTLYNTYILYNIYYDTYDCTHNGDEQPKKNQTSKYSFKYRGTAE